MTEQQARTDPRQPSRASGNGGASERRGSEPETPERTSGTVAERRGGRSPARLVERDPYLMMDRMSRELEQVWEALFGRSFGLSPFRGLGPRHEPAAFEQPWLPRIDVEQRDDALVVHADLPGVSREDVQIEASEDGLVISGERRDERTSEGSGERGRRVVERTYGSFFRQVPLPPGVDPEQVRATMQEGVLEVVVPLPVGQRRRRVQIEGQGKEPPRSG